jgi:hypothetical protein
MLFTILGHYRILRFAPLEMAPRIRAQELLIARPAISQANAIDD